ncbi:hypothetical protein LTR39_003471 [Cryomyces antarcticus]|nr:hypothetical protein LTR39_003471 [Cryomyces antarcticus]
MVMKQIPESLLETKIDITPPVNERGEKEVIDAILDAIYQAKNPLVFVDALVHRHNAKKEASKLVDILAFPTYAANMGKIIIDETHPSYVGIYNGRVSTPGLYEAVETSDLALVLGSIPSDTNSGGFTRTFHDAKCIQINPHSVVIGGEKWLDVHMKPLLTRLVSTITKSSLPKVPKPRLGSRPAAKDIDAKHITQSYIWDRIAAFLRPGDVLLADTGTAAFGLPDATFPKDVIFITQTYYGSIGYCTPAALGSDVALSELHTEQGKSRGRTILVTGDGSLQLTIQEVGTMIARGFQPIIIVINNAGYTIERVIHGARQPYNDIVAYDYSHMLSLFGASKSEATTNFHRATKRGGVHAVTETSSFHPMSEFGF